MRRRRLLRAVAAAGGASYAASKRRARMADSSERIQKLKEIARQRDEGILTDQEFAEQKAAVLAN